MASSSAYLPEHLHAYTLAHTTPADDLVGELVARTREALPEQSRMQICPEQATLLAMLTRLTGARDAVEVGTFTGLSSLAVARALPADGTMLCLDVSEEYTAIAREFWAKAGVEDKVTLTLGPAVDSLAALPDTPRFDLAFIDADKVNYERYWAALLPRMRTGGVIVVDNVLWSGRVLDPAEDDADTAALRAFNALVARDHRVDTVMLLFADGLTVARKR
ncbi:O-methyltransferase [Pilimelia terevasa]|uniref:O-methyltransferase n=1 Tax=Pilimelia terevasa TaxID=53372 RepID=A0A8J3FI83_9ACTN|nr:O-methyltransferase [Pilimelia terevasa]GGK17761.1 O-methyltransferase [Pilimelia terevasa]